MQCLQTTGELTAHPAFPFLVEGKLPPGAEQCWLGGWDDAEKMGCLPSLAV